MHYPARYRPSAVAVALGLFLSVMVVACFYDGDINALGAKGGSCPQYEAALAERRLPVRFFSAHMWAESKCDPSTLNADRSTRDLSFGLLGINLFEAGARAWFVGQGYGYWNLFEPATNLNAAVLLYNACGQTMWVKPYRCIPPKQKAVTR